jgi:Mg2+/Co2+ transporter CorB
MRTLKLITRFYGGIFLANFLVTLSCIYLFSHAEKDAYKIIGVLFWYKVITIIMVFYTAVYYKKNELYYYQNLGVSKRQLLIVTSVFDFLLWLILVIIQLLIGIPGYIAKLLLWSVLLIHLYLYTRK